MENIWPCLRFPRRAGLISWSELRRKSEQTLQSLEADIDPATSVGRCRRRKSRSWRSPAPLQHPMCAFFRRRAHGELAGERRRPRLDAATPETASGRDDLRHPPVGRSVRIADRVSVMRDGKRVFTTTTLDADRESLVKAIVGPAPGRDVRAQHYACAGPGDCRF